MISITIQKENTKAPLFPACLLFTSNQPTVPLGVRYNGGQAVQLPHPSCLPPSNPTGRAPFHSPEDESCSGHSSASRTSCGLWLTSYQLSSCLEPCHRHHSTGDPPLAANQIHHGPLYITSPMVCSQETHPAEHKRWWKSCKYLNSSHKILPTLLFPHCVGFQKHALPFTTQGDSFSISEGSFFFSPSLMQMSLEQPLNLKWDFEVIICL